MEPPFQSSRPQISASSLWGSPINSALDTPRIGQPPHSCHLLHHCFSLRWSTQPAGFCPWLHPLHTVQLFLNTVQIRLHHSFLRILLCSHISPSPTRLGKPLSFISHYSLLLWLCFHRTGPLAAPLTCESDSHLRAFALAFPPIWNALLSDTHIDRPFTIFNSLLKCHHPSRAYLTVLLKIEFLPTSTSDSPYRF